MRCFNSSFHTSLPCRSDRLSMTKGGKKKFPTLAALADCVLTLSHENADPEREF